MVVYVRQFNGYPHSYQNWEVEYKNLKKDLLGDSSDNDNINADLDVWYHIGYDSPWIPDDQLKKHNLNNNRSKDSDKNRESMQL